jgi:anti-sigma B factor antagonist
MKLTAERVGELRVVGVPSDALVSHRVDVFKHEMDGLLSAGDRVLLDLSAVRFADSSGCSALLQIRRRLLDSGGELFLCGATAGVRALFDQLRMERVVQVFPTRQEALAAVGA